jgi:glucan biosynthesis protein C
METRKYFLDWLRVAAFVLLIIFHVGMLYVSWPYNLKSHRLFPAIEPLMNVVSAWRLALLFMISGVAARFLIDKLGPGAFARDRLRRLLPVALTGMYVVIPPQTYLVLVSRGATHMGFATFWWTQYLRANQTLVRPFHMTMPTWDHIWFLVYLLIYALLAAGAIWAGKRLGARADTVAAPRLSPSVLLLGPGVWMALANLIILTKWPITDTLVNDWGGHLKWAGLFATGLVAARQDRFWALLEAHWGKLLVVAAALLAIQSRVNDPAWSVISGLYGWVTICALCGRT